MILIKKSIAIICALIITLSCSSAFGAAEMIVINGNPTQIPAEMGTIQERNERTFVPVRFIMENLGCKVEYIDDTKLAVISSSHSTYLIQEGNPTLYILPNQYIETEAMQMDTSAYIETVEIDGTQYGRMYVPIRFLAEAIGYDVGWDETTQTVTLTMAE